MNRYEIVLYRSQEIMNLSPKFPNWWVAWLMVQLVKDALAKVDVIIEEWTVIAIELGRPIPESSRQFG